MIDQPAALAAIARLRGIEWRQDPERLGSQVALMREYLRRAALVAEALGAAADWPWYDAAVRLTLPGVETRLLPGYAFLDPQPEYRGPGTDTLEDSIIALNKRMAGGKDHPTISMWKTCLWYIRWASVRGHPALAPLGLPDLYEPLIVMYGRGGWFRMEHAYIDLGETMIAISLRDASQLTPLPALDAAGLDGLDIEYRRQAEERRSERARKTP